MAPRSAVALIGTYGWSEPSTEVEPTDGDPDADVEAPSAAPEIEEVDAAEEGGDDELQAELADHPNDLTRMVDDLISVARRSHYALGLVAIEFDMDDADPDQLRNDVDSALGQVLRSTEEREVVVDPEERLVWLAVPGLLRRRAVELASQVRPLLRERSLRPAAVAVSGYPRDGVTGTELLADCHRKLETPAAHESVAE